MRALRGLALATLGFLGVATAHAQNFPSRPVTIISPYQAGGTSDIISRLLAQKLGDIWKQSVIVENRPGANGSVGVLAVARGPADGHTLLAVASSALTLNPLLYRSLGYDVGRDLAPITRTGSVPNVVVVHPSVPAATIAELVALTKAKPGSLNYASQGNGSNGHLNGEMFRQMTGADMVHVPYKGSAPAVADLIGGHVQVMFDNLPSVLEQVRAGQLRALAVTTAQRAGPLPAVPTMIEAGVAGFETSAWFALLVAKATPEPLRAEIERAVVQALADPELRDKLAQVGITALGDGSTAMAQRIDAETRTWREVIQRAKISID
ncbi:MULTISPECIES: tripartite tricarboxylate transporter substrate binding protein [unclassified Beijerinckia]|uniref:Bug family tripartite tricarboxylate transporter substrate binding protein n=1 Tax=unclassified Beijerinckia TaxID=2638183 RepID=UPI00147C38ED|nr:MULTISPECIES: tripartite tricarboxylate transporter substrate binding protein [unclassified Beijerinckia]